jgi:hypothetical protein
MPESLHEAKAQESARPRTEVSSPAQTASLPPPAPLTRHPGRPEMLRLQRSLGNYAVARLMSSRDASPVVIRPTFQEESSVGLGARHGESPGAVPSSPPPPIATQPSMPTLQRQNEAEETATWQPPYGLDEVSDSAGARDALQEMWIGLYNLSMELRNAEIEESEDLSVTLDEAISWVRAFSGGQDFTANQAQQLAGFSRDYRRVYSESLSSLKRVTRDALQPIAEQDPPDTTAEESQLAEQMHFAFIEGGEDQIGEIRDVLNKVKDYSDSVGSVLTWASRLARATNSARTLTQLNRAVGQASAVGDALEKVTAVATAARSLATISGLDNQAVGEAQNTIRQFEAGLELIDTGFTFFKAVPVLGTLWSSYYMPVAQSCIRLIGVIARGYDVQGRQLALVDFWEQQMSRQRRRGRAPRIPTYLLRYFPGGQPMLNYVYSIVHDGSPRPSARVRRYFLEHKYLFNAGRETRSRLRSESTSSWYDPTTWGDERLSTDLTPWVQRNRDAVWAMLYGNLPQGL